MKDKPGVKKGFIKGETLRLLITNSVEENLESQQMKFSISITRPSYT